VNTLRAISADVRLFTGKHRTATVAYVSQSVVNLSGPQNNWLMLCDARLGGGPYTVLVEPSAGFGGIVSVGETVIIGTSCVAGPAGDIVTWEDAHCWTPQAPLGIGAGVDHRITLAEEVVGALGCFEARPLISVPVRALREGCLDLSPPKIRHALAELVGLGPGLTPAGDDYLGGYLAALLHISGNSPRAGTARMLVTDAMSTAHRRTQPLSAFLLGEYRTGMIPEFLSTCLQTLLHPSTTPQLSRSVRRVLSHGATSGTEMMLGLLDCSKDFAQASFS
jgi:hypothetical protein